MSTDKGSLKDQIPNWITSEFSEITTKSINGTGLITNRYRCTAIPLAEKTTVDTTACAINSLSPDCHTPILPLPQYLTSLLGRV